MYRHPSLDSESKDINCKDRLRNYKLEFGMEMRLYERIHRYFKKEFSLIENGFKEEEKRAFSDYNANDCEYSTTLAFLAYKSDVYQVRMWAKAFDE